MPIVYTILNIVIRKQKLGSLIKKYLKNYIYHIPTYMLLQTAIIIIENHMIGILFINCTKTIINRLSVV